jgi:WD40 repeat protein
MLQAVRAIALPAGSSELYTGSQDESIRVWDCGTGQVSLSTTLDDRLCLLEYMRFGRSSKSYSLEYGHPGRQSDRAGHKSILFRAFVMEDAVTCTKLTVYQSDDIRKMVV